jgi:uncharacterized protein YegJ (DUF2314 family)
MPLKSFVCAVIIAVVVGAWLWRERRRRKDEAPASIVLLLHRPKPLNVQILAQVLTEVTGKSVRAIALDDSRSEKGDNRPVGDMVAGASPHFISRVNGISFAIHNLSAPYMADPAQASESFVEMRLRKAVREHTAWLSMDILNAQAATPDAYRIVGRVLARLVDDDCLALYYPPLNQFAPCKPDEMVTKLNSDDPINAVFREVTEVPVIPIDDDPRLRAAEAEARRRFPEFEAAFQKKDGSRFTVKALITANGNSEHIWVEVDRVSMGKIEGRLGNDPVNLGDLKLGSKVEVPTDSIEDWVYLRNGNPIGEFTGPVIQKIVRERSKKK